MRGDVRQFIIGVDANKSISCVKTEKNGHTTLY